MTQFSLAGNHFVWYSGKQASIRCHTAAVHTKRWSSLHCCVHKYAWFLISQVMVLGSLLLHSLTATWSLSTFLEKTIQQLGHVWLNWTIGNSRLDCWLWDVTFRWSSSWWNTNKNHHCSTTSSKTVLYSAITNRNSGSHYLSTVQHYFPETEVSKKY